MIEAAQGFWTWADMEMLLDSLPRENLFLVYALELSDDKTDDCTIDIALANRAPIKIIEKLLEISPNSKAMLEKEEKTAIQVAIERKGILWNKGKFSKILKSYRPPGQEY